jgi:hypothetical protein
MASPSRTVNNAKPYGEEGAVLEESDATKMAEDTSLGVGAVVREVDPCPRETPAAPDIPVSEPAVAARMKIESLDLLVVCGELLSTWKKLRNRSDRPYRQLCQCKCPPAEL